MTIIGFVRHGVTDWNKEGRAQGQTNIPLNEEGRSQAQALAERMAGEQWDVIYSSDLSRASETASIVNEKLGVEIVLDERLREVNSGQIEGTTEMERIHQWGADWLTMELGKEKDEAVLDRANKLIRDILLKHPNKRVLIVSHGAFIGLTLKHLIPRVDTKDRLHNSSMTILKLKGEFWDCDLYNCIKHLKVLN
jgi:probable phosphoglycerate mutase